MAKQKPGSTPESVRIDPFDYALQAREGWARDTGNSANCISDDQLILFDPNLSDQGLREVLLHEVLHGIWAQTGLSKRHDEAAEEEIVWTLAPRLLSVLRDNPKFFRWVTSGPGR